MNRRGFIASLTAALAARGIVAKMPPLGLSNPDRESRIWSELSKYPFVSGEARKAAFQLFRSQAANGLPIEEFIETELQVNATYLFAAKARATETLSETGLLELSPADLLKLYMQPAVTSLAEHSEADLLGNYPTPIARTLVS